MATVHKDFQFYCIQKLPSVAVYDIFKTEQDTLIFRNQKKKWHFFFYDLR